MVVYKMRRIFYFSEKKKGINLTPGLRGFRSEENTIITMYENLRG